MSSATLKATATQVPTPSLLRTATNKKRLTNGSSFLRINKAQKAPRALPPLEFYLNKRPPIITSSPLATEDIITLQVAEESVIDHFKEDYLDRHGRIEDGY